MACSTHVICFGNELHGDDGFGPALHAELTGLGLPPDTRLMRADAASPSAIDCFEGCDQVLVIDALSGYGPPGSLHVLAAEAIAREETPGHGAGVGCLLETVLKVLPQPPQISIVGVEADRIDPFRPGLSRAVAAAMAAVPSSPCWCRAAPRPTLRTESPARNLHASRYADSIRLSTEKSIA